MLCEKCKKNKAVVLLSHVINGEKMEHHLCAECAAKEGLNSPISFQDILQGLLNISNIKAQNKEDGEHFRENIVCPVCGLSYDEFRKIGKFGCSACYDVFAPKLNVTFKNIHGSIVHKGKVPKSNRKDLVLKREKETLRGMLNKAIENEEFEEAARIRDKIRSMEG